jgi:lipoprotein-anchoring transpeptidase ErfK/SrfK
MKTVVLGAVAAAAFALMSGGSAQATSLIARVDVPTQTMQVIHYGKVIHTWPVSTARPGYITPAGNWRPKRMHKMWYSRKYDMSPMPYSVFYDGGYAIHGTSAVSRLGTPASHGCVRLETQNAKAFYELVQAVGPGNTRVIVVRDAPATTTASAATAPKL